ncbi:MAG: hypothetical protein K8R53_02370 [Bacteroidales bacterium]|nr:hypothetical protein [Bacteroidales bacterium]
MENNSTFYEDSHLFNPELHNNKSGNAIAEMAPDKQVVRNLMGYSKALFVLKTGNSGIFDLILN